MAKIEIWKTNGEKTEYRPWGDEITDHELRLIVKEDGFDLDDNFKLGSLKLMEKTEFVYNLDLQYQHLNEEGKLEYFGELNELANDYIIKKIGYIKFMKVLKILDNNYLRGNVVVMEWGHEDCNDRRN